MFGAVMFAAKESPKTYPIEWVGLRLMLRPCCWTLTIPNWHDERST